MLSLDTKNFLNNLLHLAWKAEEATHLRGQKNQQCTELHSCEKQETLLGGRLVFVL